MVNRIEKLLIEFLWQLEKITSSGLEHDLQAKEGGGLGFGPLALMNKAVIGKWLCRLGEEQGSL